MKSKILTITFIFFVSLLYIFSKEVWDAGCAPAKPKYEFQKGMCYVTWNKDRYASKSSDESLERLAKTGTKWVAIVPTWYQQQCHTAKIFPTENSPADSSVIHAIDIAHSLGMKVMLKPHLDLIDLSSGSWRGEIACVSEPEWNEWFQSYRDFILHYAKIAEEHNVEMLCIGTELTTVAMIRDDMWKNIVIKPVRQIYRGFLTYAANWNDEFNHVGFWDALDYVGIDAYYPLSEKDRPSFGEIKDGWQKWVKELEEFQAKVKKPIIFPEVGYYSAKGTARKPWEEPNRGEIDVELQADCYQALLETFWDKDWFYGVYWWKWGTNVRFGGLLNRGYSMQNKPAQDIVKAWYNKPVPKKKKF
ncbi:MAG: glycoside hydrolase TIM-barrel-like domain-containing protein [Candidatus Omnitrophica bacterium]|nr:glycoside hydrolase TIM-barrel-like domain-containing protein [Candidatus Omnitrophota bacterium]